MIAVRDELAVITGANGGLGLQTALALARRGMSVVLACRSMEKGRMVSCSGGLPPSALQALYSMPRAPSRLIMLGQVRRIPVSLMGSWTSSMMWWRAAASTTLR